MEIAGADARRVLGIASELEDAGSERELRERAVGALMELIPADAGQAYRLSADGTGVSALSVPEDSFHADPMVIYEHPLDHPLTDIMLETPTAQAWRVSDVAGDRQWRRTHCYNLDFRPFGLRRHLVATAGSAEDVVEGYALMRSGADFSERERDLFGFAQLHLVGVEQRLAERQRLLALSAAALALAADHGWGVALLGEDGRAQPLNALAAELLTVVGDDPRLRHERSFTVRDVEVRPVPSATPGLPDLLLLRDLARGRTLARLFGVTEQEHRTLRHLHDGRTATEAARRMGLSPTTVRGYIASLHRKLEAGHTAALLRRGRDLGLLTD
ncbi:helix-turn-helix transcriptional regulator [Streptomyces sp. NPDC001137]|uniref:helix-turn-helix transcriptional regulator n=1 Tax=Streptomyces sp. NPDC001137 TaxID=3154378 RepID=UPI003326A93A